ncbi:hypothetical protein PsalN5692_00605 [Piscirickettsia salmonis]|uniref:hypothetical protein n=1 Tax=Piscirickettsia salmonis TaxID=1238 RepID=UPI0012B9919C|nr:hypothetical protein [Piscirickettsia salmonis]QGP49183.1 hypothetical protein PsalN5692_00605 [Piscirickettsia salmonis]
MPGDKVTLDQQIQFDESKHKSFQVEIDESVLNQTDEKFHESLRYLATQCSIRNQIHYQTAKIEDRKNLKALYERDFLEKYATTSQGYDILQLVLDEGRELDQQLDDKQKKPFIHHFSNLYGDPWAHIDEAKYVKKEPLKEEESIMLDVVNDDLEKALEIETQLEENNRKEVNFNLETPEPVSLKAPKPLIVQGIVEPEQKKQTISPLPSLSEEELKNLQVTLNEEALKKTDGRAVKSLRYLADQYSKINKTQYRLAKAQDKAASFKMPYYKNCLKNDYIDDQGGYWIEEILEEESKLDEEKRIFTNHLKSMSPNLYNKLMSESSYIIPDIGNEKLDYYSDYEDRNEMPLRSEGVSIKSWVDFKIPKQGESGLPAPNPEDLDFESSEPSCYPPPCSEDEIISTNEKATNEFPSSQPGHKGSTDSIGGLGVTQAEETDLAVNKGHNRNESMESVIGDQLTATNNITNHKMKGKKQKTLMKIMGILKKIEDLAKAHSFSTQKNGTSFNKLTINKIEYNNLPEGICKIYNRLAPLASDFASLETMEEGINFAKKESKTRSVPKEGLVFFNKFRSRSEKTMDQYKEINQALSL